MICYENSPSSVILSLILKVIGADLQFKIEKPGTDLMYDDLICERLYGELLRGSGSGNTVIMSLMRVSKEFVKDLEKFKKFNLGERLVLDENGNPVDLVTFILLSMSLDLPNRISTLQ